MTLNRLAGRLAGYALTLSIALGGAAFDADDASARGKCSFAKRPPLVLRNPAGFCKFDPDTLAFSGTAAEQARCLLNPVQPVGRLGPALETLPEAVGKRVGGDADLPSHQALGVLLQERGAPSDLIATLADPVSHAHDNDPLSRSASYVVFHDTSTPNYRTQPWPVSIDDDPKINNLARYECDNDIERAHVFINRQGSILLAHDFTVPWRATKFETAKNYGSSLKGLFLHIEMIQPRRALRGYGRRNDFLAPEPGFSQAQYDALALVYAVASRRAGFWLIPAFHSVLDEGIRDKHDDPQNFRLESFAWSLDHLIGDLRTRTAAAKRQ
ncbi:MAG: hypothetical protein ABWY35_06240 [Pseudorhodoplanes sp.]